MDCEHCKNYEPITFPLTVADLWRIFREVPTYYILTIEPTPGGGQRLIAVSDEHQTEKIVLLDVTNEN